MIDRYLDKAHRAYWQEGIAELAKHYELDHQLLKLVEEDSEFSQAWVKHHIDPTRQNFSHLLEEIADQVVVMSQLVLLLSDRDRDEMLKIALSKVNRQLERIA